MYAIGANSIKTYAVMALVIAVAHGLVGGAAASSESVRGQSVAPQAEIISSAPADRQLALGVANLPWDAGGLDDFIASVDGHVPALWAIWNDWGGAEPAFPLATTEQVAARGAVPMIWWQPVVTGNLNATPFTNQRIINGEFDDYIRQWASDAHDYGGLIVLRFAHEMDGNWFPWGIGRDGNTAVNFKSAWQHIWNIFRGPGGEAATNVLFLWSPYQPTASVYPGAQYVDYVGFTALNWVDSHGLPWRSMNQVLSPLVSGSRQFNKPIIVAELGSNTVGGSKAAWIRNGYAAAYANYPEIVALVYFNVDTSPGQPDWRLTTPADALIAYREILAQPRFQGRFPPPATVDTSPPVASAPSALLLADRALTSTGDAWAVVSWPAAADDYDVVAYELQHRVNRKAWKTLPLSSPTGLQLETALKPGKKHTFRVRARDAAGNWSAWATSVPRSLVLSQENALALSYLGQFSRVRAAGASGGYVRESAVAGSKVQLQVTGSSVAFVSANAVDLGIAQIWLDGALVATVDLYAPAARTARVVWSMALGSGTHSLEVLVTGHRNPAATSSRVDIDAFLVLR